MHEAGIPRQRHDQAAAVGQVDGQFVVRDGDVDGHGCCLKDQRSHATPQGVLQSRVPLRSARRGAALPHQNIEVSLYGLCRGMLYAKVCLADLQCPLEGCSGPRQVPQGV